MTSPAEVAQSGPLVFALGAAALAGLVSFLSPCILPLVPGYLSYMTGLAGADLNDALQRPTTAARWRIAAGTGGFVAGFAAVFMVITVLVAGIGRQLLIHERTVQLVAGLGIIALGLAFIGFLPQREWRLHKLPNAGLASAPVLGAVFAISWTPCLSPTLTTVLGLAAVEATTPRAIMLALAYCLGLGLPFLVFGLGFRKVIGITKAVRRHSAWVTRIGGAMLVLIGLALATGVWGELMNWLRATVGPGTVGI